MPQSTQAGEILSTYDDLYADWFEAPVTVRNYISPEDANIILDEYGDANPNERKPLHPDSPISTTAQIETSTSTDYHGQSYGIEVSIDAEIFLDDSILLTSGGETDSQGRQLAYPSEIEDEDGRVYDVIESFDEGNGTQLVLAQYQR
jgi:hypothetical protein